MPVKKRPHQSVAGNPLGQVRGRAGLDLGTDGPWTRKPASPRVRCPGTPPSSILIDSKFTSYASRGVLTRLENQVTIAKPAQWNPTAYGDLIVYIRVSTVGHMGYAPYAKVRTGRSGSRQNHAGSVRPVGLAGIAARRPFMATELRELCFLEAAVRGRRSSL